MDFKSVAATAVLFLTVLIAGVVVVKTATTPVPVSVVEGVRLLPGERLTTFTAAYTAEGEDAELEALQCPIPMKDRVANGTGIQCVWASIETIGRWAEEPKLVSPPLTSRNDCKSYSSPTLAAKRLTELHVKFEQSFQNKEEGVKLIRKAMAEGRGCLWGVPGHAMVICHFDEAADKMCWIDNSDRTLKVQTTTIDHFYRRWDTWALVVYADNDIIPQKVNPLRNLIPIIDRNGPQGQYPKDYIPAPKK